MQRTVCLMHVAALSVCGLGLTPAFGQVHDADVVLRINSEDRLETGLVEDGILAFPRHVATGVLGIEGFPNFTNDPGFDSPSGSIPSGTGIGYVILGPLLVWSGEAFDTVAEHPLVIRKFGQDVLTPLDDVEVQGPVIGAASSTGRFHHHVQYYFDEAETVEGVFLLSLRLYSDSSSIGDSEPVYIVFAQGSGQAEQDEAAAWVEANVVGGGGNDCPADLAEPTGTLNIDDVLAFLNAFASGDAAADLAEPTGTLNIDDVLAFLNAFAGGCG